MYAPHVEPEAGLKWENSIWEQMTRVLARPTESMPSTRYVKGLNLYMKIQKWGKVVGDARTLVEESIWGMMRNVGSAYPQKIRVREKRS